MRADEILIINGKQKFEAENVGKNASGAIIIDGMHVCDTLKCVHCSYTWIPIKGSGRQRGFCVKCHGVTCGSHECEKCLPFEEQLNLYEKNKLKILR